MIKVEERYLPKGRLVQSTFLSYAHYQKECESFGITLIGKNGKFFLERDKKTLAEVAFSEN